MGRWLGKRNDYDERTYAVVDAEAFSSLSLAVAWRIGRDLKLTGRVSNLFNQNYEEMAGYPAPGRLVYVGLDFLL
jgi:outer membrane cobalamin receptor